MIKDIIKGDCTQIATHLMEVQSILFLWNPIQSLYLSILKYTHKVIVKYKSVFITMDYGIHTTIVWWCKLELS